MTRTAACPHCGRTCIPGKLAAHVNVCAYRPEIAQRMREVLRDVDGYAVTRSRYAVIAVNEGLPSLTSLEKHFGTWRAALVHFDVPMHPGAIANTGAPKTEPTPPSPAPRPRKLRRVEMVDAAVGAEVDALTEEAQRAIEAARYPSGLAVCSVRELPDGRVACVLR